MEEIILELGIASQLTLQTDNGNPPDGDEPPQNKFEP
jgi:hypothetical protein